MVPLVSHETSHDPACDHSNARTAQSCACRMVSKLNVRPFHKVNSPEALPVSTRRPSGVQRTQLTGVRILFVDVCTYFVQYDVEVLDSYARGGRS